MKFKPKEILVNLPVALLFEEPWEIASFASTINTILHGKVRLKVEELGTLGERYVGLFYLQRNNEYQQLYDEFTRLIEEEQIAEHDHSFVPAFTIPPLSPEGDEELVEEWIYDSHPRDEDNYAHSPCNGCEELEMLHQKEEVHCRCGGEMNNGKCQRIGQIKVMCKRKKK